MKQDGKTGAETSEAAQTTVQGDVVNPVQTPAPTPAQQVDPTRDQSPRGDGPAV
jgi:hypothetical protein